MVLKDTPLKNGHMLHVVARLPPRSEQYVNEKFFLSIILSGDKYFDQFFDVLNCMPCESICLQIWDILEKLPTNLKMKTSLQNLQRNKTGVLSFSN